MSDIHHYNKTENITLKLNDYDGQREQPLHPSSIIELTSSDRLYWVFKVTSIDWIIPLGIHVQYAFVYLLEISLNFGTNAAVRMFSGNSRR